MSDKPWWYGSFRPKPFPTLYGPLKTPVTADVLEAGLLFAVAILAFSFLLILPGLRLKKRFIFLLKIVVGLFILAAIFLCNFGQEWEVAHLHTKTQYKAGIKHEIEADIDVKIGLRSVNITLRAGDDNHIVHFPKVNETINYNERFSWDDMGWTQGRGGFGPFAGLVQRQFREGQLKGLPYPILWIAEYFTPDGEGIRWGRYYRQAGYFSHIMLWLAFPLYILSLTLVMMVMSYGGIFFIFTGLSMLTANLIYAFVRNPTDLKVPFDNGFLVFTWGWCFWLCLVTGALNILIGLVIFLMDCCAPDMLQEFLNVDVAGEYEQFFLSYYRITLATFRTIMKEHYIPGEEELSRLGIIDKDGTQSKVKNTGEKPKQETLRYGYRRRTTKIQKLVGTARSGRSGTQRNRTPVFVQQMYENGSVQRAPANLSEQSYAYDNPTNAISLDEIATSTPNPDDMRTLHIDSNHPDMDNYDNMPGSKLYTKFKAGNDARTGRRASDDPIYSAAVTAGRRASDDPVYTSAVPTFPVHMNGTPSPYATIAEENVFSYEKTNHEDDAKPPPLPPCGILGKKRGFAMSEQSPPIYDNDSRPNFNRQVQLNSDDETPNAAGHGSDEEEDQGTRERSPTVVRFAEFNNSTSL